MLYSLTLNRQQAITTNNHNNNNNKTATTTMMTVPLFRCFLRLSCSLFSVGVTCQLRLAPPAVICYYCYYDHTAATPRLLTTTTFTLICTWHQDKTPAVDSLRNQPLLHGPDQHGSPRKILTKLPPGPPTVVRDVGPRVPAPASGSGTRTVDAAHATAVMPITTTSATLTPPSNQH